MATRSKILMGAEKAPHRSLLKSMGLTDEEISRPIIAIANSFSEFVPGHVHLRNLVHAVKDGIRIAGGTPIEFATIAVDDGIAMGHEGMKYSLPSREIIADSVEIMVKAHPVDGLVMLASCDKILPGMLMAALRLDIPSILVSGGPMLAGNTNDKKTDLATVFEAVGAYKKGLITEKELSEIENSACPTCGSCAGMFTANSLNCLSEILGLSLPYNGTVPAVWADRIRIAKLSGMRIVELVKENITARKIVSRDSFLNAIALDMSIGCSTNTVLHLLAMAYEADVDLTLEDFDTISQKVPTLCTISPLGEHRIEDLHFAGGIPAIISTLVREGLLKGDCLTVSGKTINEIAKTSFVKRKDVIRTPENPVSATGGLSVLFGSLSPDGSVVKTAGVPEKLRVFSGKAKTFNSEEEAISSLNEGKIKPGDIIVLRYEGPKGGPGMREMLSLTASIVGMGMHNEVALITDGRFSGASKGCVIGHVSPEAAEGGPIGLVEDGDEILIDIPNRKIELLVPKDEIEKRRKKFKPIEKPLTGYLKRYARLVTSASKGAILALKD